MNEMAVKVNMGELKIGRDEDILAAYGVGSCIIVACYDINRKIAAMLHGILPANPAGKSQINDNKYLDSGIDNMVKALLKDGVSMMNMQAKIFGGAKMFDTAGLTETIGERNIRMAKESLAAKGILIAAEDTGKNYGRTIEFYVGSKKATVKSYSAGIVDL